MQIVPGDIINYDESHIGEIYSVDQKKIDSATCIYDLLKAVTVIESVYNGQVCNVITRNMMMGGTYLNKENETGSWQITTDTSGNTVMRKWVIRRLQSKTIQ